MWDFFPYGACGETRMLTWGKRPRTDTTIRPFSGVHNLTRLIFGSHAVNYSASPVFCKGQTDTSHLLFCKLGSAFLRKNRWWRFWLCHDGSQPPGNLLESFWTTSLFLTSKTPSSNELNKTACMGKYVDAINILNVSGKQPYLLLCISSPRSQKKKRKY